MGKGDVLASGGKSATFGPHKSVSQDEWERIWGATTLHDNTPRKPRKKKPRKKK